MYELDIFASLGLVSTFNIINITTVYSQIKVATQNLL